ncbi:retinol dehydrogenase 11 isoform X2 [Latimeria chalumnae]|uniref:retinol dehydrogenase 11 isoform X2 n=1 Tax=Latimeria chalumnae TaxID=7897 RepID=UPI00313E5080
MEFLSLFSHPFWFITTVIFYLLFRAMKRGSWRPQDCPVDLKGKTAIVTGANTGIGKFTALDLACRKARVILACRNPQRGQRALEEIQRLAGNTDVHLRIVDTSSLASVRKFAERINQEEKRLDILVNNAGASGLPIAITPEGLELTFATNFLGPFLLTSLLLDLMKRSSPGRIVNVASMMHTRGEVNVKNLKGENLPPGMGFCYNSSKLMNILHTNELARRLEGTGITANSVHPGVVWSEVIRNHSWKTSEEGAVSSIYCAVSEEAAGITGKYFDSDCSLKLPSPTSQDEALAKKLWDACEQITGLLEDKEKQK